ncbi:hypothetical protein C8J48_3093 [Desmospora activa DSM 45169]|uniref:Uncharacterized protein n=1 Tax=Desmospora activa DSM 45169 TaxID=1121389 RepID=A0A2T4Z4E8_9BACL|nr:hypothetical protein C8J48_3093 [Desmospora activa DSM 45169]
MIWGKVTFNLFASAVSHPYAHESVWTPGGMKTLLLSVSIGGLLPYSEYANELTEYPIR